jgi:hypothetical protein
VTIEKRERVLLLLTLAVLTVFAVDRLGYRPLAKAWKTNADRIAGLRQNVADGSALLQREKFLRDRWNDMRSHTLPNNASTAEQQLFKTLDAWSQDSRAGITAITPQWKHDSEEYMTLECRVDAGGDIATLSRLLYNMERDPMALQLQSVEISARDSAGRDLALSLRLSGLVLTPGGSGE